MSGLHSRNKGKVWEREVARELRAIFGASIKRGWQCREGQDDCDVTGSPFWVEAKHHRVVNIGAAMRQAMADTKGPAPLVVSKSNRCEPLATMRWSDFLALVRRAYPSAQPVVPTQPAEQPREAIT
jgi:hypothetical protein